MAKLGKNHEEILKYYFTGVDIKEYEKPCRGKPLINKVLVIDPGHGGEENPGVKGAGGHLEKDIVLDIGRRLARFLIDLGATVKLTREGDNYVSLKERSRISNRLRPDFFISLHMNSFANSNISGTEIYHYRGDKEGEILGNLIIEKMKGLLNTINKGVKTADFFLLKEVRTSSIHIEIEYLTNPIVEESFENEEIRELVARAITEGIVDYYSY